MMLLVDLDNTLVDRATAFEHWATGFVRLLGRPDADALWLIAADRDGYEPRDGLARAMKERFELGLGVEGLVDRLPYEHVDSLAMEPGARQALAGAREQGWKIAIVTNGTTSQQALKIHTLGLETCVDAVVISEAEGVKKPDPEIFRIAARRHRRGSHRCCCPSASLPRHVSLTADDGARWVPPSCLVVGVAGPGGRRVNRPACTR